MKNFSYELVAVAVIYLVKRLLNENDQKTLECGFNEDEIKKCAMQLL